MRWVTGGGGNSKGLERAGSRCSAGVDCFAGTSHGREGRGQRCAIQSPSTGGGVPLSAPGLGQGQWKALESCAGGGQSAATAVGEGRKLTRGEDATDEVLL